MHRPENIVYNNNDIVYVAGKTARKFHASNKQVRAIMGPIGSGKSVSCCIELFMRMMAQTPNVNGVRRTRWAVVRNTYPELKTTTILTWTEWMPSDMYTINWGPPIKANVAFAMEDGTFVESELLFLAIDRTEDTKKLLSLEITGGWINEAREVTKQVFTRLLSRCGRFPSKKDGGQTWTGVIMDTNPPPVGHWYYNIAELEKPPEWDFLRQPGALTMDQDGIYRNNPEAENVEHLSEGYHYWRKTLPGSTKEEIKVTCLGEYGSVFSGKPVYDGVYNDAVHCSDVPLTIYRGLPIFLGWDYGTTPACVICQLSPLGQLRVLREFFYKIAGIRQIVSEMVRPELQNSFQGMRIISFGDPTGDARFQGDITLTASGILAEEGIPTEPGAIIDFAGRRGAVVDYLLRMVDKNEPGFIIDPSCKMIREGFLGGYMFQKVQVTGAEERFREEACKNDYSHIHDALQQVATSIKKVDVGALSDVTSRRAVPLHTVSGNQVWQAVC
jgi:hypothetical protein